MNLVVELVDKRVELVDKRTVPRRSKHMSPSEDLIMKLAKNRDKAVHMYLPPKLCPTHKFEQLRVNMYTVAYRLGYKISTRTDPLRPGHLWAWITR